MFRIEKRVEVCIVIWPDGPQGHSRIDFYYNLTYFVLTYLVPLLVMGGCFIQMSRVLWGGENIGESSANQRKSRKNKQKIVKMFGCVITIFCVCWLPYHAYFIYSYYDPAIMGKWYTPNMYLAFYWLAMANSCVNTIIYYWMNKRFRAYFNQILCCGHARQSNEEISQTFTRRSIMGREGEERFRCSISCPRESISRANSVYKSKDWYRETSFNNRY